MDKRLLLTLLILVDPLLLPPPIPLTPPLLLGAAVGDLKLGRMVLLAVGLVDGAVVAVSLAAFAALVIRLNLNLNPVRGILPLLAGAAGIVAVLLWAAYKYLFVVYTGSTPGLRAARLRLERFDGAPLSRRTRRWRVLTSFLSAFSAGLGYLWCILDQDRLCWHDRITRTRVAPARKEG